jgi:anti-sigma B factor antagonist
MQLKLTHHTKDGVVVVNAAGRIVFGEESSHLRDVVKKLLAENNKIVLNLAGTNYIDSGGLGTLVGIYTSARTAGGAIKLANLTQRVGDLLQITKLLTVFETFDSEDEAVESFKKAA